MSTTKAVTKPSKINQTTSYMGNAGNGLWDNKEVIHQDKTNEEDTNNHSKVIKATKFIKVTKETNSKATRSKVTTAEEINHEATSEDNKTFKEAISTNFETRWILATMP